MLSYFLGDEAVLKELLFYTISRDYIKYLSDFENHISYNKEELGHTRPYLGIVLRIENYDYFAPLYSYKETFLAILEYLI